MQSFALREGVKQMEISSHRQLPGAITTSLRVIVFPGYGGNPADLLRGANNAHYSAKGKGRDCVVVARAIPAEAD